MAISFVHRASCTASRRIVVVSVVATAGWSMSTTGSCRRALSSSMVIWWFSAAKSYEFDAVGAVTCHEISCVRGCKAAADASQRIMCLIPRCRKVACLQLRCYLKEQLLALMVP